MKRKKTKIILTGYRACGKSSIGRLIAQKLGFEFVDTDPEIEKNCGSSITEMVAQHGWPYFRDAEQKFLQSLVDKARLVIAPGGGAIQHKEVWQRLMETSFVVWLKVDVQTICQRLAADQLSDSQRPSLTGEDIFAEVQSVLATREPLYKSGSHVAIIAEGSQQEIAEEIIRQWEGIDKK